VKVAVFDRMDECSEAEVQRMLPMVSAQRRDQALRYKHVFGQFCCLKSWLMLRELTDDGTDGFMDEWTYNEYGKPSFAPSPLRSFTPCFSISHCKEAIAVAVDDRPVGIDIEAIRHANGELIARTMNAAEQRQIHSDRDFTRLWTQKEAVVKWQGTGIESFDQLQSVLSDDRESARPQIETFENEKYIYSIAYGKLCSFGA